MFFDFTDIGFLNGDLFNSSTTTGDIFNAGEQYLLNNQGNQSTGAGMNTSKTPAPAPANDNSLLYIIGGGLFLVVLVFLYFKKAA